MSSRKEKTFILRSIIEELHIYKEEKDLYYFSMEILDDDNFEKFFQKITQEFSHLQNKNSLIS